MGFPQFGSRIEGCLGPKQCPPANGGERVDSWQPELEGLPPGCTQVPAIVNPRTGPWPPMIDEFPFEDPWFADGPQTNVGAPYVPGVDKPISQDLKGLYGHWLKHARRREKTPTFIQFAQDPAPPSVVQAPSIPATGMGMAAHNGNNNGTSGNEDSPSPNTLLALLRGTAPSTEVLGNNSEVSPVTALLRGAETNNRASADTTEVSTATALLRGLESDNVDAGKTSISNTTSPVGFDSETIELARSLGLNGILAEMEPQQKRQRC